MLNTLRLVILLMYLVFQKERIQGVVKRHGFAGVGQSTHGQHNRLRAPGSIGAPHTQREYLRACVWQDKQETAKLKC